MRSVAVLVMMFSFGGFGKAAATTTGQQPLHIRIPTCARDCANQFLLSESPLGAGHGCTNATTTARQYEECLDAQPQNCLATQDTPPSADAVIDLLCPSRLSKRDNCIQDCSQPTCNSCPDGQSCVLTSGSCISCATMECQSADRPSRSGFSNAGGGGKKLTTLGITAISVVCGLGVLLVIIFFIWGIKRRRARVGARRRRGRRAANSQPLDQGRFVSYQQQQKEAALREAAMKEAALVGAAGAPGNDEHAKKPLPGLWQEDVAWKEDTFKEVTPASPMLGRTAQTKQADPGKNHVNIPKAAMIHSIERKPLPGRQKSTFGEDERAWMRASEMERECQREEANLLKPPKAVWF